MKRVMLYLVLGALLFVGVVAAYRPLRQRARAVAVYLKVLSADTTDEIMSSANYQRFAVRRRSVENMQKTLLSLARAESLFVADSGRPFTNLPQSERYAVQNDPSNILWTPRIERDRWSAQVTGLHTTMACSITAMLDTTTGRYHAGAPVCGELTPEGQIRQ